MPFESTKTNISNKLNVLKILTGRRQTSWLFTKSDLGFEPGTTEKQIPLMDSATPPPPILEFARMMLTLRRKAEVGFVHIF